MDMERKFEIFKEDVFLKNKKYWPVTYIMKSKNGKKMYIGKSRDFEKRMIQHKADEKKSDLNERWVISHSHANESISYYLESFLIHFGRMNAGIKNINTKIQSGELYKKDSFHKWKDVSIESKEVYEKLVEEGIFTETLEELKNHAFSKLNPDLGFTKKQMKIIDASIKNIIDGVNFHIEGAAGTGKTAIMIKIINDYSIIKKSEDRKVAVYSASTQNRWTIKKYISMIDNEDILFFNTLGDLKKWMDENKEDDLHLITDEAQSLSESKYWKSKVHLKYKCKSELEWIKKNIKSYSLFFDLEQSDCSADIKLRKEDIEGIRYELDEQFRIKADVKIYDFFKEFLGIKNKTYKKFEIYDYDIEIYDDLKKSIIELKKLSNNNSKDYKILSPGYNKVKQKIIVDGVEFKIENKDRSKDIMLSNIEKVQGSNRMKGLSVENSLVVIFNEIRMVNGKIIVDPSLWQQNKIQAASEEEKIKKILSSYYILLTRATSKLLVYIEDDNLREYFIKMKNERLVKSQRMSTDFISEI